MKISSSLKLALIFLVFGVIYILFSDRVTLWISNNDLNTYNRIQNYKGILFIVVSSFLIYMLSKTMNASLARASREQEEALRRYNVLGMATNDAVWDLNLQNGECFTNRTLQEMFGYTADELTDNNTWWTINLHPEDKARVMDSMDAKLKGGGTVWQDEYRFRCKDGSYKTIFDRGYIMRDRNGLPYRLIGAMQDVTDQRELQQQLVEEKLRHKNEMAQNVILAQEAERKKLGEELHDNINQLLSVIKLYIENARTVPEHAEEMLRKSSEYLLKVIDEIRLLSRSLIPPMLRDIGLLEAIREMVKTIVEASKIQIHIQSDGFDETLLSESQKLMVYRIIQEQLNNVIRHSRASEVEIKLSNQNKEFRILVTDNGRGFDQQHTKMGVGLNNIRNRLESTNGRMNVYSAPGKGCRLEIQFEA